MGLGPVLRVAEAATPACSRRFTRKKYERWGLNDDDIGAELEAQHFDPAQRSRGTLLRAVGGELGFRTRLIGRLNVATAAFLGWSVVSSSLSIVVSLDEGINKQRTTDHRPRTNRTTQTRNTEVFDGRT